MGKQRTIVYVDGFNLYYRAVRNTPHKWLNLAGLCKRLLPSHNIVGIKYFTAMVQSRPSDPDKPKRQIVYHRALKTIPNLTIVLGHFLQHDVSLPLSSDPSRRATVIRTEEKGSDVNLAAYLVHDAHSDHFDSAAIISADSDLLEAIKIVRHEIGKPVIVLSPRKKATKVMRANATEYKTIRTGVLRVSQFPPQMADARGRFYKPPKWT